MGRTLYRVTSGSLVASVERWHDKDKPFMMFAGKLGKKYVGYTMQKYAALPEAKLWARAWLTTYSRRDNGRR